MTYKRLTQKLKDNGIENISLEKRLWGCSPEFMNIERQRSRCFKTPQEAYEAVVSGFRPEVIQ